MSEPQAHALMRRIDTRGEYRWRVQSSNGNIISVSSEGYKDDRDRERSIQITLDAIIGSLTPFERTAAIGRILDGADRKDLALKLMGEIDDRELPETGYVRLASDEEIDDLTGGNDDE